MSNVHTSLTVTMLLIVEQTSDKGNINELTMTKKTNVLTHDGSNLLITFLLRSVVFL